VRLPRYSEALLNQCILPIVIASNTPDTSAGKLNRLLTGKFGSVCASVLITALGGVALVKLSTSVFQLYGWTLFLGLPFLSGFTSVFIYSCREERTWRSSLGVATLSVLLLGALALCFALDGAICLLMAAPLAFACAYFGAAVGYLWARCFRPRGNLAPPLLGMLLILPLLMGFEAKLNLRPPVFKVVSSVDIHASPEKVWRYVIAFPPIPEPHELLFRVGIAYPKNAQIAGTGVGAIRYCNFSTGPFVEPIQVWQPPSLLKFGVTHNPAPMREWSPYPNLQPPHLHNFMVSQAGQFRIIRLNATTTRLEGTTWYYHRLWPTFYWRHFSDAIIHRIHLRVLNHIKELAEGP